MKCGLLGRTLGHSYSPQIHAMLGDYSYTLFEREPEDVEDFIRHGDFDAINVTIPYKKTVMAYLDRIDPIARRLGSVNTIVRRKDGTLDGYNTDFYGFQSLVAKSGLNLKGKKVLLLGSGGTSVMAQAALRDLGADVVMISRSGQDNYQNLSRHADAAAIVNTTPLGMYPNTGVAAVDCRCFPKLEGVLDVVYNPARTQFLLDAQSLGCKTINGLWMLVAQAKQAAEHFTGSHIDDDRIAAIHSKLRHQMENIVLIGMPGCGKSTIGALLAQKTGKTFVDADTALENSAHMTIPDIFAQQGEPGFRQLETDTLSRLGKASGQVIATGGGCVTVDKNYPLLHQNGTIVWIRRNSALLPTEGRPLSQAQRLEDMERIRRPMYEAFADAVIDNDTTVEDAVQKILELLEER